jgi:PIN domain nuclease of toxin-antitoxin system
MKLLLDTHALLWWHNEPSRLSEAAYDAIRDFDNEVFLSVVSGWEIQIKAQLGKLRLSKPLSIILEQEQSTNAFRSLPVTMAHVFALDFFPLHHRILSTVWGCRLRRDSQASVRYSERVNSSQSSFSLHRTDRHDGIVG